MLQILNGAGPAAPAFPAHPLLLEPVPLPWRGTWEGCTVLYDVEALRELVDTSLGRTIAADLYPRRGELLQLGTALDDAALAELDDNYLEEALRIIQAVVYAVEWPYATTPPAPADPLSFMAVFNDRQILWLASDGVELAGGPWIGPLSLAALRHLSMRIMGRPNP